MLVALFNNSTCFWVTLPAITFGWWFGNNSYFLEHVFTFYRLKSQKTICMYMSCYCIKQYVCLQFVMRFILKWNFLFLLPNAGGHGHNTVVVSFCCWGVKKYTWFCQISYFFMSSRRDNFIGCWLSNGHFFIYTKQQNTVHYSIAINIINGLVNLKTMRIITLLYGGVGVAFPLLVYVTGLKICTLLLANLSSWCLDPLALYCRITVILQTYGFDKLRQYVVTFPSRFCMI